MSRCRHCGQGSLAKDSYGPVCPDCWEEGYADWDIEAKPEKIDMSDISSKMPIAIITSDMAEFDRELLIDALTARAEAAEKALAEVTAERDSWGALLADAYGAGLDWEEMLMDRVDQAALARIATIEREMLERAAAVAEVKIAPSLKKALAALEDIFDGEPEWPNNPKKELRWCRSRARRAVEEIRAMIEEKTDE